MTGETIRRTVLFGGVAAAAGTMVNGGLNPRPFNAPPAGHPGVGVQPGTSGGITRARLVLVFGPSGAATGVFVYTPGAIPGPGVQPIAWLTNQTSDPYGNIVIPNVGAGDLAGDQSVLTGLGMTVHSGTGHNVGSLQFVSASSAFYLEAFPPFSQLMTDPLSAVLPGSPPNPVPETFHAMTPLAAGFAAGGTSPRYKLMPDNTVRLTGGISLTANQAANTTFFTLPAGYRPAVAQSLTGVNNLSGFAAGNPTVGVTTGGALQIAVAGTAGNVVGFDGLTFPLD